MIVKLGAVIFITALFVVLGEVIIRRNRRDRALRAQLADTGTKVTGTVRSLDKVSAGKYGTYKVRAHIDYDVNGTKYTHIAAWWPENAEHLQLGGSIELSVDATRPTLACVAGAEAPKIESDATYRWLAIGVGIVALIAALVS